MGFDERKFCVLCAWRQLCQKKFSYSDGLALNCADYVRDLTIKDLDEVEFPADTPGEGKAQS